MKYRGEKVTSLLKNLSADFFSRETSTQSLITVINVTYTERTNHAVVFISVFPAEKEHIALDFVRRKRGELREYILKHAKIRAVPVIDFSLDLGEKNRQRIDEISNNI